MMRLAFAVALVISLGSTEIERAQQMARSREAERAQFHRRYLFDLPGDSKRLLAGSIGVEHVFVNGVETVVAGAATGDTPGVILRSGRGTYTVDTSKG